MLQFSENQDQKGGIACGRGGSLFMLVLNINPASFVVLRVQPSNRTCKYLTKHYIFYTGHHLYIEVVCTLVRTLLTRMDF